MSVKVSKRAICAGFHHVISLGYCEAQALLRSEQVIAYSTRREGWACDFYIIDDVLISTGYAPAPAKNVSPNIQALAKAFELQARELKADSYEDRKFETQRLLRDFVAACVSKDQQ